MFEIYLRIIVFALQTSNWVELSDIDPPWSDDTTPSGNGVLGWFKTLQDLGYHWEASRVLRILRPILHVLSSKDVATLIFDEIYRRHEQLEDTAVQSTKGKEDDLSIAHAQEGDADTWVRFDVHLHRDVNRIRRRSRLISC